MCRSQRQTLLNGNIRCGTLKTSWLKTANGLKWDTPDIWGSDTGWRLSG